MKQILYLEVPTPNTPAVRDWLQQFKLKLPVNTVETVETVEKVTTPDGCRLRFLRNTSQSAAISENSASFSAELSIFTWSVQRTTYLKVFRWSDQSVPQEAQILKQLTTALRSQFPPQYPEPPAIDLSQQTIFEALAPYYPTTVKHFRSIPNGEYDLTRVYWWEQRWREGVRHPQSPRQVIFRTEDGEPFAQRSRSRSVPKEREWTEERKTTQTQSHKDDHEDHLEAETSQSKIQNPKSKIPYDLIYIGGALGVIHAAVMARLGYRVLLIERLPFGRMNREWNISRDEFQTLIDLGLLTPAEFESVIAREYKDGFNKFFDANNPAQSRAAILHTPTVLNVGIDAEKLLRLCGEKLRSAGGEIWDETEFLRGNIDPNQVTVQTRHLPTQEIRSAQGRILVDAMGTASPIVWQLNQGRAFDSVCPTVGAVIDGGFEPGVWDARYGDVLNSHGDISRGRQLIWELFPGKGEELTFYLFHYHEVHPDNPGSLLEMYEDFFSILSEYRRCDLDKLKWKKATFGYIPGYFSIRGNDRRTGFDRLVAIGDAASLQSPLVFTGFGSLVRNLPRLTDLLDTALRHNLVQASDLNQIRAYQSNIAVTWLFSKGMMVPTGRSLPPERVNAMLNTFFGILASESPQVADQFIKDRAGWIPFNRMALKAAVKNPALLLWIWELAGRRDLVRWLGSYLNFTLMALIGWLFQGLPDLARSIQPWLEPRYPALWFWLLVQSYTVTYGVGKPRADFVQVKGRSPLPQEPTLAAAEPLVKE